MGRVGKRLGATDRRTQPAFFLGAHWAGMDPAIHAYPLGPEYLAVGRVPHSRSGRRMVANDTWRLAPQPTRRSRVRGGFVRLALARAWVGLKRCAEWH